jgi:hypothetical protein
LTFTKVFTQEFVDNSPFSIRRRLNYSVYVALQKDLHEYSFTSSIKIAFGSGVDHCCL